MESGQFKIVYNSDLIIRDRAETASLCVFYDKVLLPYTSEQTSSRLTGTNSSSDPRPDIKNWEMEHSTLFKAEVLERLPRHLVPFEPVRFQEVIAPVLENCYLVLRPEGIPEDAVEVLIGVRTSSGGHVGIPKYTRTPKWSDLQPGDRIIERNEVTSTFYSPTKGYIDCKHDTILVQRQVGTNTERREITVLPRRVPKGQLSSILSMPVRTIRVGESQYIAQDLANHLTRTDINIPQIFTTVKGQPVGREVLAALQAEATFKYLLPKIHTFHPTQILELREKVAATREGFTMHLWKLSKGLEERAKESTSIREIAVFAKNLIETDLIPDYREFSRQLASHKAGKWEKVLDAAGKIVEIDAAPWTPKFWGLLLKSLGLSVITAAGEQEELLSNKYQAFKFMSEVEGAR